MKFSKWSYMITIAYLSLQMLNFQVIIYDRLYNQGFKSKQKVW